jgi:hypothetical protein
MRYKLEKYHTARQATDDSTIRCMNFACWITQATDTHTHSIQYLLPFHGNSGYANASQCYVMRALHVLLRIILFVFTSDMTCLVKVEVKYASATV